MVCKNCGNNLRENEKFCTVCGTYNDTSDSIEEELKPEEEMEDDSYEEINEFELKAKAEHKEKKRPKPEVQVVEYTPKEDPYVVAYIGEDYKWIAERPFNIYALLLSWIYFLYRKMYLIGIIGLAITGIVLRISPIIVVPYIVLSMVGCGLFFNKIYLDTVERKVARIQAKSNPLDDVEAICKKKGGVNVFMPLLIFFIFLAIMLFSYFNFNMTPAKEQKYWEETSTNLANCKTICRQIYAQNQEQGETIEEMGCEITTQVGSSEKNYSIFLKINKAGTEKYILYQKISNDSYIVSGDTDQIEQLEEYKKAQVLRESDQEFLQVSKDLPNTYATLKDDSDYEDKLISKYANTSAKTHFIFIKDDLFQ